MTFNSKLKLHLACGNDEIRPQLSMVCVHNGKAYATNSRIAVEIDLRETTDLTEGQIKALENRLIHAGSFKRIITEGVETIGDKINTLSCGYVAKTSYALEINGEPLKYPKAWDVIADAFNSQSLSERPFEFGINTKYLDQLIKAMGGGRVAVYAKSDGRAVCVRSLEYNGVRGIIMPTLID